MLKPFVMALAAASLWTATAGAETASVESQGRAPLNVNDLVAAGAPPVRDPRVIGPVIDMSGRMTSAERSVGDGDGTARTAVDYSLAPNRVFGAVGFICLGDDAPITARDVGPMAGTQDGRLLGGTIRYSLK